MAHFVRFNVVLFIFCTLVSTNSFQAKLGANTSNNDRDPGYAFVRRAVNQVAKGLAATQKLLRDAQFLTVEAHRCRKYTKPGDLDTAMRDFHSVAPINVHRQSGGFLATGASDTSIIGQVGDKLLILRPAGDKSSHLNPVLEIRSQTNQVYDKIVYKPPK